MKNFNITVAAPTKSGAIANATIEMHSVMLVNLVELASFSFATHFSPKSKGYITPLADSGSGFNEEAIELSRVIGFSKPARGNTSEIWGHRLSATLMSQLEIMNSFVDIKNKYPDSFLVCEEPNTTAIVYSALVHYHNWKVACIRKYYEREATLQHLATGWQVINVTTAVKDWPTRYGFGSNLVISNLPNEEATLEDTPASPLHWGGPEENDQP